MKKYIKPFLFFALGFAAQKCEILSGIYPCGCALLCVLNKSPFFSTAYLGVLASSAWTNIEALPQSILPCIMLLPFLLLLKKLASKRYCYIIAVITAFLLPACTLNISLESKVSLIFSGLFSACLIPVIERLYCSFSELRSRFSLERADVAAVCFLSALAVSSLPKFIIFGFDIRLFAMLFSSAAAISAFGISGSIWTSLCALMWIIKGGDYTIAFCLILGGMLAGLFSRLRGGILLGFTLGDFTVSLFLLRAPYLSLGAVNLILGCVYQAFLPKSFVERLKRLCGVYSGVRDLEMSYIEGMRLQQKSKIESAAGMYSELARSFARAERGNNFRRALIDEGLSVCEKCEKSEYCLKCRRADTVAEISEAADGLINADRLNAMPVTLSARCIKPAEIAQAMRERFARLKTAQEESGEDELYLQLKSVADLLFELADGVSELPQFDIEAEKQIYDVLQSRIGNVEQVHCRKTSDGIILTVSLLTNRRDISNEICFALKGGFIGEYLCIKSEANRFGGFLGTFVPMPKFAVEAYALRKTKNGEEICGDSYTYYPIEGKSFVAAVSDGAGSGRRAATESEGALALLEAFSAAHISRNDMFRAMNRLLLLKGDSEAYSTVDVTEVNLQTGVMHWTKIGAVPGYIFRQGEVEKIEAGALPMGIVSGIAPATAKMLIKNGDIIVLVTDGIYDGLCRGKTDTLADLIVSSAAQPPKAIADTILSAAAGTGIDDDMTVLVLKISA